MKKPIAVLSSLTLIFLSGVSYAGWENSYDKANSISNENLLVDKNDDSACEATLCLAGVVDNGDAPSECKKSIAKYFSILALRSHGRISWDNTAKKRESFLEQCQSADSDTIKAVQNSFGKQFGL